MPHDSYKTWPKARLIGPNDDVIGGSEAIFKMVPGIWVMISARQYYLEPLSV